MTAPLLEFIVPGQPVPKARPRVTRRGITFTPKPTRDYERMVRNLALAHAPSVTADPLRVEVHFFLANARRVDVDNLAKGVLDALNPRRGKAPLPPVVWEDDSQIVELVATKQIDRTHPRAVVRVERTESEEG